MSVRLGVISDTHDQLHYLPRVMDWFKAQSIELLIHCGDWVAPLGHVFYAELGVPIYGVFGNNDGEKFGHWRVAQRLKLDLTMEDEFLAFDYEGRHLGIYHGTSPAIVDALVKCGDYDAVFYGHNHLAKVEMVGTTLAMNPGTLLDKTNEKVQGASVGLYTPATNSGEIFWLNTILNEG